MGCHSLWARDANTQNVVWGSENNNARGTSLLEYLADVDLEILNRGSSPTFITSRCQCVIDITLCDRRLAQRYVDWWVDREDTLSDHRRIKFNIEGRAGKLQGPARRDPRTTDWTSFKEELEARLRERRLRPSNVRRLEDEVDTIHEALIGAFHKACPIKASRQGKNVAWWSRELDRLRVLSRRLCNYAYRTKSHEDWTQYRNSQEEYKRLIKKSKETAWKDFCDDLEALPQRARLRRVFSGEPTQGLGEIILPNGEIITQPNDILEHLIQVHFPDSNLQRRDSRTGTVLEQTERGGPYWRLASEIITMAGLRWAVDSFDMYKSLGPDGLGGSAAPAQAAANMKSKPCSWACALQMAGGQGCLHPPTG
ncbi:uncharacterized protein [Fopius arisanus]|uniref:Endonuclease/exonuclease/phosphatase domain-containing protein n=1 Tax=Fopius arisanus TaxID=64838 RepID=A0A9R1TQD5_9HYME|nr:PREDICTED: uncharacterized protein LOC105272911 [Fopius arisanus]